MRLILAAILLTLAGCSEASPKDYALRLEMSRGLVPMPTGVCGGTAVGRNLILTATHCLKGATGLWVDGKPVGVLEGVEDGRDHTILRVDREFKDWAQVWPGGKQGGTVNWIGNPSGYAGVHRRGYVAKVDKDEIWIDAQAFGGDSGSGVFSRGGYLRMVVTGVRSWSNEHGFRMSLVVAYPIRFTAKQWREIRS